MIVLSHLPLPQSPSSQQYAAQAPSGRQVWPTSQNGPAFSSHASHCTTSFGGGKQLKPLEL